MVRPLTPGEWREARLALKRDPVPSDARIRAAAARLVAQRLEARARLGLPPVLAFVCLMIGWTIMVVVARFDAVFLVGVVVFVVVPSLQDVWSMRQIALRMPELEAPAAPGCRALTPRPPRGRPRWTKRRGLSAGALRGG